MSKRVLNELQFTHQMESELYPGMSADDEAHLIRAHLPDRENVGEMSIRAKSGGPDRPRGHINEINVDPDLQRQGIGTALWNHAHELARQKVIPVPKHSKQRTDEGDQWARKVGGPLPYRPSGGYH